MSARGVLLAESLLVGVPLEGIPLVVDKIERADAGDPDAGQPRTWTLLHFTCPEERTSELAGRLSDCLEPALGWYCDFRSVDETFVVFAGRVFRYRRGDVAARADAEAYARSMGVPESQIDWPEGAP